MSSPVFYLVRLFFYRDLYDPVPGFTEFIGFYLVFLRFGFYRLRYISFHFFKPRIIPDLTVSYWVLPSFTELN